MFLHEHPKFRDLVETIAFERKIPLAIVEKDYWVTHALWGFEIIKRFSEDIDLQIDPPKHLKVYAEKNHDKLQHQVSRQKFLSGLSRESIFQGCE